MSLRFNIVLAAWLAFIPFAVPSALADAGQPAAAEAQTQASMVCPQSGEKRLNIAQTSPGDCCKDHKGVCGCRAGKIICCDRTASDQPGCTCHGDDGFLE